MNYTLGTQEKLLHKLAHYLPSQFPLKDFVHHNSLHAFQHLPFHTAMKEAAEIFGYKTYLNIKEFRELYEDGKISDTALDRAILNHTQSGSLGEWRDKLILTKYNTERTPRVGRLRAMWKDHFRINLDKEVHPTLFRFIGNYLDQGVALSSMPEDGEGLMSTVRMLEAQSLRSFFRSDKVRQLALNPATNNAYLLHKIVGDEKLFELYLFDMQFAHPGWSGMVHMVESNPSSMLRPRNIALDEFVTFELLLELDLLERKLGKNFLPLAEAIDVQQQDLFDESELTEFDVVNVIWQEALENTYFDQVLSAAAAQNPKDRTKRPSFQALFCIDDRESSLRNYVEDRDPASETFGTAGFFNLPIYYRPEQGRYRIKLCPNTISPEHIILESEADKRHKKESSFLGQHQKMYTGWITAQTLGFWSAMKMTKNIFMPGKSPLMVSSFQHMDPKGSLTMERKGEQMEDACQVGFSRSEMIDRVEGLLRTIGMVHQFAPLIYLVGHGASSINNTYYAGYDCGACCGRPGSVNARLAAAFANRKDVREGLVERGINIPADTVFVGALHDTTRDEIQFYDLKDLSEEQARMHQKNVKTFKEALEKNAVERARRFDLISNKGEASQIHAKVKQRAVSLFEPRPEWNHATNALCIVGRRPLTEKLFLDRRAFLQSYDYRMDSEGTLLSMILGAITPVCGGINLEYYFSRVDNTRLGAGSKLPHNVMGLIGVANGMEGDLRTGLPFQMVNIHDPLRLMMVVEHTTSAVLSAIQSNPSTYEWYKNEWIVLVVIDPETRELFKFKAGNFEPYSSSCGLLKATSSFDQLARSGKENIPVHILY